MPKKWDRPATRASLFHGSRSTSDSELHQKKENDRPCSRMKTGKYALQCTSKAYNLAQPRTGPEAEGMKRSTSCNQGMDKDKEPELLANAGTQETGKPNSGSS